MNLDEIEKAIVRRVPTDVPVIHGGCGYGFFSTEHEIICNEGRTEFVLKDVTPVDPVVLGHMTREQRRARQRFLRG